MTAWWTKARNRLWFWCIRNHDMGCILPWYLVLAKAVIYPVDSFRWFVCTNSMYDIYTDTYNIGGVRFSYKFLMRLAQADGGLYQITRVNDNVVVTEVRRNDQH